MDLRVHGAVDLGLLPNLAPVVTAASGRAEIDAGVRGTLSRPSLLGSARLERGTIDMEGIEDRFENVRTVVRFSERRVLFENLHATLGSATLDGSGSLEIDGPRLAAWQTRLSVRGFTLGLDDAGTSALLEGRAGLEWRRGRDRPLLTGDLEVKRLRYRQDFVVTRDLGEQARRRARRAEIESFEPGSEKLDLDVRLHASRDIWIQNSLVEAELKIDESQGPLRLVGTDRRPGLVGTLSVLRGNLYFRSATFRMETGTIVFRDANRIRPHFDLSAESEVRDWRLHLQALGTPDDFRLFTRADPYLSEEDVLLVLTLGLTAQELASADMARVGGSAAADALAEVSGVDREVRRLLAVDDVRVGTQYSPETGRTEPNLTVGRRLSRNVRASATAGLSEQRSVSANIEWRLSRSTSVQGSYDNAEDTGSSTLGNVGIDLRWHLDFE
jgi:translocation and assembly module TamB